VSLRRHLWHNPVRTVEVGSLQDSFLICAVLTILVIRLQLWATNYPQLGGGRLHIAHLLWGGVAMVAALLVVLSFLGPVPRRIGAVLGGIGFGFFIDEVGKFVTQDNDYFFKPAAAIIYVVFIVLWLVTRATQRRRGFSEREYLANAVQAVIEAARADMDVREQRDAFALLDRADPQNPLVGPLRSLLEEIDAAPSPPPTAAVRLARRARAGYARLLTRPRFVPFLIAAFLLRAAVGVVQIVVLIVDRQGDLSFVNWADVISSLVALALTVAGVARLRQSRLAAYRMWDRSLLVSIFVTQVFAFVESQFSSVFGLLVNLAFLFTLRAMMRGEVHLVAREARAAAVPSAQRPAVAAGAPTGA
jgi:hypothetical protein